MYSSDLYSESDITTILPPYEIEPHGIVVAGEEVVYSSSGKKTQEQNAVTKNYSIVGSDGDDQDRNGLLSSRMDLNVAVIRKVSYGSANVSPWFPKKVVVMTDKRRIETMAWAHSSNNAASSSDSAGTECHIEDDPQDNLAMDSDPSLSSINAPVWYASHASSLPSTSSTDSTEGFQISPISIEPDIEVDPSGRPCQSLNSSDPDCAHKTSIGEDKFSIAIQHFNVPIRIYPGHARHKIISLAQRQRAEYPCPVKGCTSILRTRTALRKHALVHAERKFACNQCGRSFVERTKLNRHMLTHTGERAFKCEYAGCNKAFSLEANLRSHIKTHTGEKSYKCPYCTHAFTHPYNLRVHVSRRHKGISSV